MRTNQNAAVCGGLNETDIAGGHGLMVVLLICGGVASAGKECLFSTYYGFEAGYSDPTCLSVLNTFIGTAAGYSNSSGNQNIFIGAYAGNENSDSDDNTYVGFDAGQHFKGTGNTFIGSSTAAHGINAIGSANTYVGHSTGYLATVAMNNVFIGSNAGYSADDPWNNTICWRQCRA